MHSHDSIQRNDGILRSDTEVKEEESPPDRIVASYAAAAHAAALACHQPISRAAEAYLATNTYSRPRHSKRSRALNHLATAATPSKTVSTVVDTISNSSYVISSSSLLSVPSSRSSLISLEDNYEESYEGWTRVVDKKAQNVVYISSDGTRLNNVDEVYAYLSTKNTECEMNSGVQNLIASHFIFEPTVDSPSLKNTLNFVHRLQTSVLKGEAVRENVSQCLTTVSSIINNFSFSQVVNSSEKVSTCRIKVNPDRSSTSDLLSVKRPKLSDNLLSSDGKPKEPSTLKGPFADCLINTTGSACSTKSFTSSNNPILNVLSTDALHVSSTDRAREGLSNFENNQLTYKQYLNKSEDRNFPSLFGNVVVDDLSSGRIKQGQSQNISDTVAKLTTETHTTGALRTSLALLTSEVVPSDVSSSKRVGVNTSNFSLSNVPSSCFDPSQANLAALNILQQNLVNSPFIEQLLAINQISHIQQRHQHHLSSGIAVSLPTQNTIENYPVGVLVSQSLSNPIVSSLTASWLSNLGSSSQQSINSSTLPELTLNSAINNLHATAILQQHQQRHQFLTIAALQKYQQDQALSLIRNAALLQHQQRSNNSNNSVNVAAFILRQQQEQQLALSSLQAQSYLAALQRQFTNSYT
ncbi:unnamed protein product [Schistosoma turkestanicum]|nr:unnamed protein product [Schistosoma turkestanicum]